MKKLMGKGRLWKMALVVLIAFLASICLFFSKSVFLDRPSDPSSRLGYYSRSGSLVSLSSGGVGYHASSDGSKEGFAWSYEGGVFSLSFYDGSSSLARFVGGDSIFYLPDRSVYIFVGDSVL